MKNRFARIRFICVFIMLYLFVNWSAYSQNDPMKIKQNMIYLEAGGMGGYGSINYERFVFIRQHLAFSVRAGFSTVHWRDFTNTINPDLLFPIAINACLGNDHKLEMGIGQTFTSIIQASPNDFKPIRTAERHTNFQVGYRYQKQSGGVFFRLAYTPFMEQNIRFRNWAGISVGYAF